MSGSFIFYFHLLGFGLLSAAVFAGWFLNFRFVSEKEPGKKMMAGNMLQTLGILFFPLAGIILLATGIGNIFNLYYGTPQVWYQQGWLVIKVVLFGVMMVNGVVFGPLMTRRRQILVRDLGEKEMSDEERAALAHLNKQMNWYFTVQTVLLMGTVFFSTFGTSKHPGYF